MPDVVIRGHRAVPGASRRYQVGDRGPGIAAGHQALADEYRVGAGGGVGEQVVRPADARFGDLHDPVRNPRGDPREHSPVNLERGQVPRVDADDFRSCVNRPVQLVIGVHLDQRDQADRFRPLHQGDQRVLLERGHDQQHHVGAMRARFPELVGADHEVLAQQRHPDGRTDGGEVLEAAAEPARLGEHADHACAAGLVVHRQCGRIGDGGERALGRAGPLNFGDHGDVFALERGHHVRWRRGPAHGLLQPLQRHLPLTCREVGADSVEDLVEHAHAVLPPPRMGCLTSPIVPSVSRALACPPCGEPDVSCRCRRRALPRRRPEVPSR